MANAYFYSNTAAQTTLSGAISNVATTVPVSATTGFPTNYPYVLALDYGGATEELVLVTSASGLNLTATRGFGGTSAQSHTTGAIVRHVYNAVDATDYRTHEAASTGVHGLTGAVVGTSDTQVLSNKTLSAPTFTGTASGGTFSGATLSSPTISGTVAGGASYTSPSITGTVAGGATYTSPTINTPTVTSPTITGTVAGGATFTSPTTTKETVTNVATTDVPLTVNGISGTTVDLLDIKLNSVSKITVSSAGLAAFTQGLTAGTGSTGFQVDSTSTITKMQSPSFTPTWTASTTNPTIGNGTIVGRYEQFGFLIIVHITITLGSTSTIGSGNYTFGSLPFAAMSGANFPGTGQLYKVSGANVELTPYFVSTTAVECDVATSGATFGSTNWGTQTAGDRIGLTMLYLTA